MLLQPITPTPTAAGQAAIIDEEAGALARTTVNLFRAWKLTVTVPVQGRHHSYHWNGERVDFVRQHDTGQVVELD